MRKVLFLFTMIAIWPLCASALEYNFTFNAGLGSYGMGGLKDVNTSTLSKLKFPAKLVDDFPAFLNVSGEGAITLKNGTRIGLVLGLASTGSRIAYSDYSGSYSCDIKATCVNYGIRGEMTVFHITDAFGLRAAIGAGTLFTDAKEKKTLKLGNESDSQSTTFESISLYVQPEVKLAYRFGPNLEAGMYCAYLFHTDGKYQRSGEETAIKSDWNGMRFGACVTLILNRK